MPQPASTCLPLSRACFLFAPLQLDIEQLAAQHLHRRFAILELAALVLAGDDDAAGHMGQAHRGRVLLHVLAARAARAVDVHLDVLGPDFDLDVVIEHRQHLDQGERGVPPRRRIEGADAHQPVDAALGLEIAIGPRAGDFDGDGLDAGLFAVELVGDLACRSRGARTSADTCAAASAPSLAPRCRPRPRGPRGWRRCGRRGRSAPAGTPGPS